MAFIKSPLTYEENSTIIARSLEERKAMIDNFVELIIFSPKGSFLADDDFGFEYWNHEYSNIHLQSFNHGQNAGYSNGMYNEVTLKECRESIEQSLSTYEPQLKQVSVSIELGSIRTGRESNHKLISKYEVSIRISGMLGNGLGTFVPYDKEIHFLMEPTVKRI